MEITIVGGGIAGLACAIALAQSGNTVRIIEKSGGMTDQGAGVQLGPNAVRALDQLGAWRLLDGKTFEPQCLRIMNALTGEVIRRFSFDRFKGRFGEPYRVAHRRDLIEALLNRASSLKEIDLLIGQEVTSLRSDGDKPVLTLGSGETVSSAAVIGADGVHSLVRSFLLNDGPPTVHRQTIYRALVPRIAAPALSADVVLWLYPGGHVVHYPVSGGRDINIVAVIESEEEVRRSEECEPRIVAASFGAMAPDLRYVLGLPPLWSKWPAIDRPPVKVWGKGVLTLAGDAAHPMLPFLAQGAAAALDDAVALGRCVIQEPDIRAAFRNYERSREPHTSRLQREAEMQARLYHERGWRARLRDRFLKFVPQTYFLSRIAWIYVLNQKSVR